MYLSIAVILVTGIIAYIWSARGLFSAFLHMLCVIVAGALALAAWEPLALWLLTNDTTQSGTLIDLAWGIALGVPFAVILTIVRVACDKLVPFNLEFDGPVNIVGGGICGLVAGTITAGLLVLSVAFTRLDTNFLGHEPMQYSSGGGSLERRESLIYPADKLTAWFYCALSNGSLAPPTSDAEGRPYSLGRMHPDLADEPWLLRVNFEEGKAKHALPPDAFDVIARHQYFSEKDPGSLLGDSFESGRKETFTYADGTSANPGASYIESYVVRFKSGAKEQSGRIVIGPGQMRLLVQKDPNDPYSTMGIMPVSVISQAAGDKPALGRWRFNAPKVFIGSVGGRDDAPMVFEFVTPKGAKPLALYVKGVRYDVSGMQPMLTFNSQSARDDAIRSRAIAPDRAQAAVDWSRAVRLKGDQNTMTDSTLLARNSLPFNITLQKDVLQGLIVDDTNSISGGGLAKFSKKELATFGIDPKLQIRKIAVSDDTAIVQVTVDGRNKQFGFLSDLASSMDRSAQPVLIDTNGSPYTAMGYVYRGAGEVWIYINPQAPITNTTDKDMPTLTRSQPDQELVLIYRVSKGVKLRGFAVGGLGLVEFKPEPEMR
jgi:hypothetical protein